MLSKRERGATQGKRQITHDTSGVVSSVKDH